MTICRGCSSAIQRLRPQAQGPVPDKGGAKVKLPRLSNAHLRHCWICSKFAGWLGIEYPQLLKSYCKRSLWVNFTTFGRTLVEGGPTGKIYPFLINIVPLGQGTYYLSCEIELNFMTAADFADWAISKPKTISTLHGDTDLDLVDSWIDTCSRNHRTCGDSLGEWYPTRLVDLGLRGAGARVIVSKDANPRGRYMTLSHRWGHQSYTKLQTSTMEQLLRAVEVDLLPQIFQDTIRIARHLGIRYLWIDSLCIKQDEHDRSDWEIESQSMDKVYSNAYINVSATLSENGSESLFERRAESASSFLPSELELDVDGQTEKYYVFDGDLWKDEIANAPLNQRAWVFQERFLARRVLHFGKHQMGWECRELDALEMFPHGLPRTSALATMSKSYNDKKMAMIAQQPDGPGDVQFAEQWQHLVGEYSRCDLTYIHDKLIAFSGVAQSIMKTRNDVYIAGMWKKTIIYHLPWWRTTEDRERFPIDTTITRAPSWSWASVDGEVNFPTLIGGVQAPFVGILGIETLNAMDPTTRDDTHQTSRACLRMQGPCLTLGVELSESEIKRIQIAGCLFSVFTGARGSSIDLEVSSADLLNLVCSGRVSVVPLFATYYYFYAIIIEKIRGLRRYRRIGAVDVPMVSEHRRWGEGQADEKNERRGRSHLDVWAPMQSRDDSNSNNESFSLAVLDLLQIIVDPATVRHVIEIY